MSNYIGINHDIRNVNGSHIQMPAWFSGEPDKGWGNLVLPNVYALDTVQKYPHGTFFREGERTWVYSKFKGTVQAPETTVTDQDCGTHMFGKGLLGHAYADDYAAGTVKALVDSTTIVLGPTDTVSYMGSMLVDDAYSGGWIMVYDSTAGDNKFESYRIVKSTYSDTTVVVSGTSLATPTTLTVDHDTPLAISASAIATVMPNEWKHLVYNPDHAYGYSTILGASCVGNITGASWMWVQTYGKIGAGFWSAALPGDSTGQVAVIWHTDGSMDPAANYPTNQIAGFTVPNSISQTGTAATESYAIVFLTMIR